jgi:bleomycin hydrolase
MSLEIKDTEKLSKKFNANPKNLLAMNAVTKSGLSAVSMKRQRVNEINHVFSNLILSPSATNQKSTGRCWMFAGLNTLRLEACKKLGVDQFEFSQAYTMFWDKLEKGNFFLEAIIETRKEPVDSRLVMWQLQNIVPDAGQWDMFVNLIKKYGAVPKAVMPETESSSNSQRMNSSLIGKLREAAKDIRDAAEKGVSIAELRKIKSKSLEEFYNILAIHLGEPPKKFLYQWRDKKGDFHREEFTPLSFYEKYCGFDVDDLVCLINAPTKDKPYNKMFTVKYLGNVVGGEVVRYLNVPITIMRDAAVSMIKEGKGVWFGADTGKYSDRDMGVFDTELFDYELVYGTWLKMDKAARLDYCQSRMGHAMVFTGVDLNEKGIPKKWRVENSYGIEIGDKGYYVMNQDWFNEYVFEVMISKKYLSKELLKVLEEKPIELPPWDPMGALA